ncbi:hypothetical protein M5K25_012387 [Dendrobium thyrsiflorum]|uniref:DUF4283 domain-containing protein n=1 Tax=Dendrobium thyrsiflorum TaxID=117978 RepID=A0ABD0V401_DENTH
MDSLSDFPPVKSYMKDSVVKGFSPPGMKAWNGILTSRQSSLKTFHVSYVPSFDNLATFSEGDISTASEKWDLTLVGYSLGKRPYFEALKSSMQKVWKLKVCWTPEGISKIASLIGIPLSVDSLTAEQIQLTFTRVCVLITKDSRLPEQVNIYIAGNIIPIKVAYDWKPTPCQSCGSIVHTSSLCPSKPKEDGEKQVIIPESIRGRSKSRKHWKEVPKSDPWCLGRFIHEIITSSNLHLASSNHKDKVRDWISLNSHSEPRMLDH